MEQKQSRFGNGPRIALPTIAYAALAGAATHISPRVCLVHATQDAVVLTKSWLLMLTPMVAYAVFKLLIHEVEDYLHQRFGAAYVEYHSKVNEERAIGPRRQGNAGGGVALYLNRFWCTFDAIIY